MSYYHIAWDVCVSGDEVDVTAVAQGMTVVVKERKTIFVHKGTEKK